MEKTKKKCSRQLMTSKTQNALGITVHDLVHHVFLVAQFGPFSENALVGQAGVVAAKHDFVLQSTTDVDF